MPGTGQPGIPFPAPRRTQAQVLLWVTKAPTVPAPACALAPKPPALAVRCIPRSAASPTTRKELADFFPLAGSLPGFYLVIPSKSLSKQYGFLTFFCGKVNSQHISNSRALLFFSGRCRGSALPRCASWAGCGMPVHSPQEENTGERSN